MRDSGRPLAEDGAGMSDGSPIAYGTLPPTTYVPRVMSLAELALVRAELRPLFRGGRIRLDWRGWRSSVGELKITTSWKDLPEVRELVDRVLSTGTQEQSG